MRNKLRHADLKKPTRRKKRTSAIPRNSTLHRNLPLLRRLHRSSHKAKQQIIKEAPNSVIRDLAECSSNLLRGAVHLKQKQKENLIRVKPELKFLANNKTAIGSKRRLLASQKGGFLLSAILSGVLPVVGGLVSKLFKG